MTNEVEVFQTSSRKLFITLDEYLIKLKEKEIIFTFMIGAAEVPGIVGNKLYSMKNMMDTVLSNSPYLVIFGAGEHSKKPSQKGIPKMKYKNN